MSAHLKSILWFVLLQAETGSLTFPKRIWFDDVHRVYAAWYCFLWRKNKQTSYWTNCKQKKMATNSQNNQFCRPIIPSSKEQGPTCISLCKRHFQWIILKTTVNGKLLKGYQGHQCQDMGQWTPWLPWSAYYSRPSYVWLTFWGAATVQLTSDKP